MLALILLPFLRVSAQDVSSFNEGDLSFKDRIAIRTNVVGWVLATPNIAFDYDVVNTPYDKRSIGLGLKCNWNTSHVRRSDVSSKDWMSYAPNWTYNLFGARFDYRFYWRQQPYDNRDNFYGDWEREWINSSKGLDKLRARLNCFRASEKPKSHISIFAGPYFSVGGFRVKFPTGGDFKTGEYSTVDRNGFYVGAGATGGIALPLYSYENGAAVDLEFGGCVGLQYAHFKKTKIEANGAIASMPRNSFLPLVTDARLSLVYRFRSISKQHTEIDYALIDRRYVARLMELDWEASLTYNDSIRALKDELDLRNQEIALYKQAVESLPEFNKAYTLEYLTPYMYMMEAPQRYTRYNKDTLPKIHIDSIEQIVDPILLSVREELDSIPHVTSAQIDKEFVNQYNNISDADGKLVNRTSLIREIYTRLNSYIEDNNSKLVASTFGADVYSEKLNKYNVKQQGRSLVEITYKDSVRTVEMTSNDKIEWLNNIKKQAWADAQRRLHGDYPGRVELPEVYDFLAPDPVEVDSVMADSMLVDSVMLDSMRIDSMMLDSIKLDSMLVGVVLRDSLTSDSLLIDSLVSDSVLVDSLHQVIRVGVDEAKAKKKDSSRASKNKNVEKDTKSEKSKKSKKGGGKIKQSEAPKDSASVALVVADSVVVPVSLTDSVVSEIVPDTALQTVRSSKVEKTKKAEKKGKSKDVSETEVADKVDVAEDVAEVETSDKADKAKKAEKKGKSKDVPETEVADEVDVASDVNKVEASENSDKAKKAEKAKKSKKSKDEVSKDVEVVDSVDVDGSVVDSLSNVNED